MEPNQRVTLTCPGFEGVPATVIGPYTARGAQPGEYVVRTDDDRTMAVRERDMQAED